MKTTVLALTCLLISVVLAWIAFVDGTAKAQSAVNGATAEIKDAQGMTVGNATLMSTESGAVKISVQLHGFSAAAGEHGVHIHAVGKCEGPAFASAGAHFNPTGAKHGLNNPEGPHAGDLPNLLVNADGSASFEAPTNRISLDSSSANSIFDADGSALVIHAQPDDLMTDPSGNSGTRIACGVLTAVVLPVGMPSTGAGTAADYYLLAALSAALLAMGITILKLRRYN